MCCLPLIEPNTLPRMTTTAKQQIVILGGGFAGVFTAKYLEKAFKGHDAEITLISRDNYFVFQPMLAEVVSGDIGLLDTISPLQRLLKKTQIYVRDIDSIDTQNQTVTLSPGFWPQPIQLSYDHLVVGLGTVTDFRGISGLHEHALPFKTLGHALRIRNHVIRAVQEANIEPDEARRRQLLTFVVAGGGFSGVEVAAAINDLVRDLTKGSRNLSTDDVRVVLVHSGERILGRELGPQLSEFAQKQLRKRGVEIRLETRLRTASPDAAILKSGERIESKTVISTVPSSANPLVEQLPLPTDRGKLKVDRSLRVEDSQSVWSLGDCALVPSASGEGYCPPTAQHAIRQAKLVANNIAAELTGRPTKDYAFKGLGKMGALGRRSAVAELFDRFRVSGFLAWVMWRAVYWSKLPGLDRKLKVAVTWLLDLVVPAESVELKVTQSGSFNHLHFEPGEFVFHKGDLGDSLYFITSGEAEVIDDSGNSLATLGPGEYFGEVALLNAQRRNATIRCKAAVDLIAMRGDDFQSLTHCLPEMRQNFETLAMNRENR